MPFLFSDQSIELFKDYFIVTSDSIIAKLTRKHDLYSFFEVVDQNTSVTAYATALLIRSVLRISHSNALQRIKIARIQNGTINIFSSCRYQEVRERTSQRSILLDAP
jgi:hypothetical protein